ncbi:MAG: diaminopimelate decarboxylase [Planctomycetaceae bacterium]|nr:diaminopimelate decarboxylase [Planctomycetaceae bacterium]
MDRFEYRNGSLFCEDVKVADIAAAAGTPVYIYSAATLRDHYQAMAEAFAPLKPTICYSIKSLSNLHVLRLLAGLGSSFDVVSGGEIARAIAAGADCSKIVYAGVGKTDKEISEAIAAGIGIFNVESEPEFENISRLAAAAGKIVRAALRLNPDVYDTQTHAYTATGKKDSKFGVDIHRAITFFETYGRDKHVRLDAIHIHIGSPIYSAQPYVEAIGRTLTLIGQLREKGFTVRTLDIGGGFAADYEQGASPAAARYAKAIVPLLKDAGLDVVLEPGRQIVANAGILLTRVQYVKDGHERKFVIVDAAMTDLIRPALYGSEHFVYPAQLSASEEPPPRRLNYKPAGAVESDIVGGVCESSDFLAKARPLPPMQRGDLLTVFTAGAYGFVMSSQYNSRPRACEVLVEGSTWRIIRRRETYEDLMAAEK